MMSEHLSQTQLAGYSGRTLDPQDLLAVDRHLASCDVCHKRLTGDRPEVTKLAVSPSSESNEGPFHLDYDQYLEPYVDGKANDIDREIVDSHVAQCSRCADDLRDLLAFKQQSAVAKTSDDAVTSARWKQWLPQWPLLSNPALATAVVIAVILAIAVLLWTTYRSSRRVEQAATGSSESEKLRQTVEKAPSPPAATEHRPENSPSNQSQHLPRLPRAEPFIALNDAGGEVLLNNRGQLEGLDQAPENLKESIVEVLATRRLRESPAVIEWSTGAGSLRSEVEEQNTFAPLAPLDVVIETNRPKFRWQALEGARQYIVTIHDAGFREVARSGPIVGTEWVAPNSLQRGVTYSWEVSALKDGKTIVSPKPPLPEARFRILDAGGVAALAKLKESAGNSHLAMGVFYWKHGLMAESEREFRALAEANPNSTLVAELLASIRSRHRR